MSIRRSAPIIEFGNETVFTCFCTTSDHHGVIFMRSREPGPVTEQERQSAKNDIFNCNLEKFDAIVDFNSVESIANIISDLQGLKETMESELKGE